MTAQFSEPAAVRWWLCLLFFWLGLPILSAAPPTAAGQSVEPSGFSANIYATPPDPLNPDPFNTPIGTAYSGDKGTTGQNQFINGTRWWYVNWGLNVPGWSKESDLKRVVVVVLPAPSGLSPGRTDVGSASTITVVNPLLSWSPVAGSEGYYVQVQVYEANRWQILLEGPTSTFELATSYYIAPGYIKAARTYAWFVWTYNSNGVPSTTPASRYFKTLSSLDVTKPLVSITSPATGLTLEVPGVTIKGTASDTRSVAGVWISINGGVQTKATGTTAWTADGTLTPGANVISAYSADASGNVSTTASVTVTYAPDLIPPTTIIVQPMAGLIIENDSLELSGTSEDNKAVVAVEVRLDEGSWLSAAGTTAWTHSLTLGPGRHAIDVRARDEAGAYSTLSSVVVSRRTALPQIVSVAHEGDGNAVLRFTGTPGMLYGVEQSSNLLSWQSTGIEVTCLEEAQTVTLPHLVIIPSVFLRFVEK